MSLLSALLARSAGRWYFQHQVRAALRRWSLPAQVGAACLQPLYERWQKQARSVAPTMLARALLPQELPGSWALARARLLPLISARCTDADETDERLRPWAQPLGDTLEIGLSAGPAGSRVRLEHLQQWGIDAGQALQAALENLAGLSQPRFVALQPGVLRADWQDGFDSARLLLPQLWSGLSLPGTPLALVTARGTLLVTGSGLAAADASLASALQVSQRGRHQAVEVLVLQERRWLPWLPPQDWPALRRAWRQWQLAAWERQKELLDQAAARSGSPPAAAVFVVPDGGGGLGSACSWVNGFEVLLPATDWLVLAGDADDFSCASVHRWQDVMDHVGHYLQPCGLQPERWRATGFPSAAELAALPPRPR